MNKLLWKIPLFFLFTFLISVKLFAGTTGKISGVVTDKETGEPLPGINIIIEGSSMGAATDLDGSYVINNIPPGRYSIIASGVGFQKSKFVDVKVAVDFTTSLNFSMSTEDIDLETIVIKAEAPMVRKDLTSSHTSVDAEQIEALPVESVSQVLALQAGITRGAGGELHIRGGRSNEIAYTVNGVSVSNPYNNSNSVSIATNAIQELSVVSGTFNAEYGNALSGIVNQVTKEGGSDYHGNVTFYTGDYLSGREETFFNIDDIDPLNSFVGEASLGGPIVNEMLSFFVSGRYSDSKGYLYGVRQHNPWDSVYINPMDPNDIRIAMSGDSAIVPMSIGQYLSATGKLTFRPFSTMKINYDVIISDSYSKDYSHSLRLNPDASYNYNSWGMLNSLEIRHALSNNTFYTFRASYNLDDYTQYLYPLLDDNGNEVDFHAGMELDTSKYHADPRYQPSHKLSSPGTYSFLSGGTLNGHSYQRTRTLGAKFDITSQLNKNHEFKTGAEFKYHILDYENFSVLRDTVRYFNPTIPDVRTANHNSYTKKPIEFSIYAQDKMEFTSMVVNIGVRYDYFHSKSKYSTDIFHPTPHDPNLLPTIDRESLLDDSPVKHQISPRAGISFPITDKGIIHFSYGHFYQMPSFAYLYSNSDFKYSFSSQSYGNANLNPQRTVSYELGLQQQLTEEIAFNLTGYYRDVRDLLATQQIRISENETYLKYVNKDYANIKGITFSLTKRRTPNSIFGATLDYTFQVSEGNNTSSDAFFLDIASGRQSEKIPIYLSWDQEHTLNGTVSVGDPSDWNVTLVARLGSGLPYDPVLFDQQVYLRPNSGRKPSQAVVDLLAEKTFTWYNFDIVVFLKVFNLFDTLNERYVYASTGRATYTLDQTLETAKESEALAQGIAGYGAPSEYFNQPSYYLPPREVRLGVSVEF